MMIIITLNKRLCFTKKTKSETAKEIIVITISVTRAESSNPKKKNFSGNRLKFTFRISCTNTAESIVSTKKPNKVLLQLPFVNKDFIRC